MKKALFPLLVLTLSVPALAADVPPPEDQIAASVLAAPEARRAEATVLGTEIEAEVDMLLHLATEGLPVSRPLPRKDGKYVTRLAAPEGTRWAVVFTDAPGKPPRLNASRARGYGELVANTHVSADRKAPDVRRFHLDFAHLLEEPLDNIKPFLLHRPKDLEFLTAVSLDLRSAITSILPTSRPEYASRRATP